MSLNKSTSAEWAANRNKKPLERLSLWTSSKTNTSSNFMILSKQETNWISWWNFARTKMSVNFWRNKWANTCVKVRFGNSLSKWVLVCSIYMRIESCIVISKQSTCSLQEMTRLKLVIWAWLESWTRQQTWPILSLEHHIISRLNSVRRSHITIRVTYGP